MRFDASPANKNPAKCSNIKSPMTPTRAVLWDMDGTLVDSADYHWQAWRDTMAREGHPITHDQFLAPSASATTPSSANGSAPKPSPNSSSASARMAPSHRFLLPAQEWSKPSSKPSTPPSVSKPSSPPKTCTARERAPDSEMLSSESFAARVYHCARVHAIR
jgi:hypothetical protein